MTQAFAHKQTALRFNSTLLLTTLALISVGVVMVASASIDFAAVHYNDPWFFLKRHLFYILLASVAAWVVFSIPKNFWHSYGWLLFFVSVFLLLIVLIPGVGRKVNGSQRWLQLGPLTLQVSELVKLCSILFFASYLANSHYFLQTQWRELFKPLLMLVLIMWLLLLEPDFGGAVVLAVAVGSMLFLAGAKLWQCLLLMLSGIGILAALVLFTPYRMRRIVTFLDPWKDQYDSGYQLTQSLIAFGRGEWLGLGLGNSIQKLLYLPESHTDFIFAIYAEEQGLVGVVFLLGVFIYLIYQIFLIAKKAMGRNDTFVTLVAFGIAVLFSTQVFINVGVVSGFLPTKGLTLPFISYGGTSLLVSCMMIALLLRFECDLDAAVIHKKAIEK
ncbi:MAG: putative lipid II flippase FtsW [Cellvibrionaceae bacterium]|nr:putative lipid II flippase FtsW [Cellvibrionaceae bacterium]